ncbi:hypothetical protein V6N13_053958 [Hibiscus sabdariffa]
MEELGFDLERHRFVLDFAVVASMVNMYGDWNWNVFQHHLPTHVLLRIAAIKGPMPSIPTDSIEWKLRDGHRFSIKSAYGV